MMNKFAIGNTIELNEQLDTPDMGSLLLPNNINLLLVDGNLSDDSTAALSEIAATERRSLHLPQLR
jgi:hypothetical protein